MAHHGLKPALPCGADQICQRLRGCPALLARAVLLRSSETERNQDDANDGQDEPDEKPCLTSRHEASRDQIHALPGPDSTKDQCNHADGDHGAASNTTRHESQCTLPGIRAA